MRNTTRLEYTKRGHAMENAESRYRDEVVGKPGGGDTPDAFGGEDRLDGDAVGGADKVTLDAVRGLDQSDVETVGDVDVVGAGDSGAEGEDGVEPGGGEH